MLRRLNEWFEKTWGWFLINGRKQKEWEQYLKDKYGNR